MFSTRFGAVRRSDLLLDLIRHQRTEAESDDFRQYVFDHWDCRAIRPAALEIVVLTEELRQVAGLCDCRSIVRLGSLRVGRRDWDLVS